MKLDLALPPAKRSADGSVRGPVRRSPRRRASYFHELPQCIDSDDGASP